MILPLSDNKSLGRIDARCVLRRSFDIIVARDKTNDVSRRKASQALTMSVFPTTVGHTSCCSCWVHFLRTCRGSNQLFLRSTMEIRPIKETVIREDGRAISTRLKHTAVTADSSLA